MNRKSFLEWILVMVIASFFLQYLNTIQADPGPTVIAYAKGMLDPTKDRFLVYMQGNMTQVTWVVITDVLNFDKIKNADMIIMVGVDTSQNFTSDELAAVKQWFDQGNKVIWITGDSDYSSDKPRMIQANRVAETLGTKLRNDDCQPNDAVRSPTGAYRIGSDITPDPAASTLSDGVTGMVLFHGPGVLAAIQDSNWVSLTDKTIDNIYRIAYTGPQAIITEQTPPTAKAYVAGAQGKFVLMAAEVMRNNGIVIFSTSAPFDQYRGMWQSGTYNDLKDLAGPQFVTNVVLWSVGLKGTKPKFQTPLIEYLPYAAVVVVVVIAAVYVFYLRRK